LVDFIGVGAQKAGTTWLFGQLLQHPEVYFPPVKEVHYFDSFRSDKIRQRRLRILTEKCSARIERLRASGDREGEIPRLQRTMDPGFAYSDEWYAELYAARKPGQRGGDITPAYATLRKEGVAHVKRIAGNAVIIYLIRDPIARGVSSLKMMTSEKPASQVLKADYYFDRGDYRSAVPRWDDAYGDRVLYIPFGDVRERPLEVLRRVEQHIGVSAYDGYVNMERPVSSTERSTLEITDEIAAEIHRLFDPQYDFLKSRFGDDFVARIA
jgi:hypothetical protein